jgi:hypothetical protein
LQAVRLRALLSVIALCAPALSCGGDPPKAPTVMRPIDEPHAVSIMAQVFREFDMEPVRNRVIHFGENNTELNLDIAVKDKQFGIAYITWQDADKLGDALPKRRDPDMLIVLRGTGDDADAHVVLLFAADYMWDDLSGEAHTTTSIAAESKLKLATRDVLRKAQHENWP